MDTTITMLLRAQKSVQLSTPIILPKTVQSRAPYGSSVLDVDLGYVMWHLDNSFCSTDTIIKLFL